MQCVILAGGLATRMRPITETIPKSLINIEGKPFIHYQLAWLSAHGVTDVVLSIGYRGELIREYVGNGKNWNLSVVYVDEGQNLRGTAGALRLAMEQNVLAEEFLVTYGDSFLPIDFSEVWQSFMSGFRPALMTVYKNLGQWDTSNVLFENGQVLLYDKFRRHPDQNSKLQYIDYGLSAFKRSVIEFGVPEVFNQTKCDLAEVFYSLSQGGELSGFEASNRFYEIGSPQGLEDFAHFIAQSPTYDCLVSVPNHQSQLSNQPKIL